MKRMFRWDQLIKTNNMRRMINQSALARGTTYKGGMLEYTKQMSKIGKMEKSVKVGGYLLLPLEAYFAYDAVQNAAPKEKTRTAVVEGSKFAGGAGLLVLGLVVGAGVLTSKAVSDVSGSIIAGSTFDAVQDRLDK